MAKRVVDLCEPVFQYVCLLSRSARKGATLEPTSVRGEIKGLLSRARSLSQADPLLANQYDAVERPLVYFIDFMIEESSLPFAREWTHDRLQNEMYSVNHGDEDFFDLLDDTLKDKSPEATQRLAVFYTCIGLGFTGFYKGMSDVLRRQMMEMSARLRETMEMEAAGRIVPEAYEHVDESNLVPPPKSSLVGLAIAVVVVVLSMLGVSIYLYIDQTGELSRHLGLVRSVMLGEPVSW